MATLNSKIREIISAFSMSDRQFAIKIGVSQSVIASMFQKGTEPSAKVIKNTLASFPEISADWFLRDKAEMFGNSENERMKSLVDTITTLQDIINEKNATIKALVNENLQLKANQKV